MGWMIWVVLFTGLFNLVFGLMMKTKNGASSILFKVVPFVTGLGCLLYAMSVLGLLG